MWVSRIFILLPLATLLLAQGGSPSPESRSALPPGDATRGKSLFEGKGGCLHCHRVLENGSRFGPDLTDIGAQAGNSSFLRGRGRGAPGGRGAAPGRASAADAGSAGRARAELESALLDPDAEILPQNRTLRLVTRDGVSITARLLNQDTFTLQIIDSKEQVASIPKSSLREYSFMKTSPMPSYRDKFTSQELADVIAYLVSLKGINK